jgi:outer membrane protein assembly factor BamB
MKTCERPEPDGRLNNTIGTLAGDRVLLPTGNGVLHALDTNNGRLVWEQWLPDMASGHPRSMECPVVHDGKVFGGGGFGFLFRVDLNDGRVIWKQAGLHIAIGNSHTSAYRGFAYSVDMSGELNCIDIASGRTVWVEELSVSTGPPVIADGRVMVGPDCFHWRQGNRLWKLDHLNHVIGAMEEMCFGFSSQLGNYAEARATVFALDLKSGRLLWQKPTGKGGRQMQ